VVGASHLREISRVALAGVGSVLGAVLLGSAWGTVPGALFGLLVAFGGQWALARCAEFWRLQEVERDLGRQVQLRELAEEQARLAARRMAVAEAWTQVFGGVVSEAVTTGRVLPLEAILARAEVTMQGRGLDPVPTDPSEWPGSPRFPRSS
jgi:hypothetical protein